MNRIDQSILRTLSYYAIFAHPLTERELQAQLWESKETVSEAVGRLIAAGNIREYKGWHVPVGQPVEQWVAHREQRWWHTKTRLVIAQKAAKKIRYIPFVDAVFVCNQLPVTVTETSDIDVFIVVRRGRLWITRLLTTIWLSLWGMRRHGGNVAKHICLSFYTTDNTLDLSGIRIETPDIYLAYWLHNLIPVFDRHDIHEKLLSENHWLKQYIPSYTSAARTDAYLVSSHWFSRIVQGFFETAWKGGYGDFINTQAREIQQQKMNRNTSSKQHREDTDVIISDAMLKFHENDRRKQYQDQWRQLCARYVS